MRNLRYRGLYVVKRAGAACVVLMPVLAAGCEMATQEVPPEKLLPVPEKCLTLSNNHKNALAVAYSSAEVSQMQITRVANEFVQCMQDAGLSKAEAKGILKKNEAEARQEAEKPKGQDVPVAQ